MAPLNDPLNMDSECSGVEHNVDSTTTEEVVSSSPEELLAQGKRQLMCENYAEAVKVLADACTMFDQKYGERSFECADAYYTYGEALLELGRLEPGVFGNALKGVPVDNEDEADSTEGSDSEESDAECKIEEASNAENGTNVDTEVDEKTASVDTKEISEGGVSSTTTEQCAEVDKEASKENEPTEEQFEDPDKLTEAERTEIHSQVEQAFAENAEQAESATRIAENSSDQSTVAAADEPTEKKPEDGGENVEMAEAAEPEEENEEDDNVDENETEEVGPESTEADVAGNSACGTSTAELANDDSQAPSNLQLAWEVLDVSRLIYEKQGTEEALLKAAHCRVKLGEVGIADEQIESALVDLSAALDIYTKQLPKDSRLIAETYYQIGIAKCTEDNFSGCAEAMKKAVDILELRLENLSKELATFAEEDKKADLEKEVSQLKALIPDIHVRIEDALGSAQMSEEARKALKPMAALFGSLTSGATSANAGDDQQQAAEPKIAKDISHLVRKPLKRSLDGNSAEADGVSPKKAKVINEVSNGCGGDISNERNEGGPEITENGALESNGNGSLHNMEAESGAVATN